MTSTEFSAPQQSVQPQGPVADRLRIVMHVLITVLEFKPSDGLVLALKFHFGKRLDVGCILNIPTTTVGGTPTHDSFQSWFMCPQPVGTWTPPCNTVFLTLRCILCHLYITAL